MPGAKDIAAQRWYAQPDDLTDTGWCIMTAPKTPVNADPATGELQVARYLTQQDAERFTAVHNAELAGRPRQRPIGRYRVSEEDTLVFDRIGQLLQESREELEAVSRLAVGRSGDQIYLKNCVRSMLDLCEYLTEGLLRVRAQAHSEQD